MNTPWGESQDIERVADGIDFVSTASHGGLVVTSASPLWTAASIAAHKSRFSFVRQGVVFLEEDCDAPAFAAAHGLT